MDVARSLRLLLKLLNLLSLFHLLPLVAMFKLQKMAGKILGVIVAVNNLRRAKYFIVEVPRKIKRVLERGRREEEGAGEKKPDGQEDTEELAEVERGREDSAIEELEEALPKK
jgi:hypothetical protein